MKRFVRNLASIFALLLLMAIYVLMQFKGNAVLDRAEVEISNSDISRLGRRGVIDEYILPNVKHHNAFELYAERLGLERTLRPGRYVLDRGMSVIDIVRMLKLGLQAPVSLTFNNSRGVHHLAGRLSSQLEADSLSLLRAIESSANARNIGLSREEMVAIFIPNTYEVWWTITPEELIRKMKGEYDRFWSADRERARKALGMSRLEVSTLASIVYEETAKADEMPRVAGVYLNRLKRRMRLQADPTVKFAVGDWSIKRVLNVHLKKVSPYNTYIVYGLPPGPISLPSIAALDAVLQPESHQYLYFCARPEMDGYHNFAVTYAEHLANARRYTTELNRLGIK